MSQAFLYTNGSLHSGGGGGGEGINGRKHFYFKNNTSINFKDIGFRERVTGIPNQYSYYNKSLNKLYVWMNTSKVDANGANWFCLNLTSNAFYLLPNSASALIPVNIRARCIIGNKFYYVNNTTAYCFDMENDQFTTLTPPPGGVYLLASHPSYPDFLYARTHTNSSAPLYQYQISSDVWTALANRAAFGDNLIPFGNNALIMINSRKDAASPSAIVGSKYNIETNTWGNLTIPAYSTSHLQGFATMYLADYNSNMLICMLGLWLPDKDTSYYLCSYKLEGTGYSDVSVTLNAVLSTFPAAIIRAWISEDMTTFIDATDAVSAYKININGPAVLPSNSVKWRYTLNKSTTSNASNVAFIDENNYLEMYYSQLPAERVIGPQIILHLYAPKPKILYLNVGDVVYSTKPLVNFDDTVNLLPNQEHTISAEGEYYCYLGEDEEVNGWVQTVS